MDKHTQYNRKKYNKLHHRRSHTSNNIQNKSKSKKTETRASEYTTITYTLVLPAPTNITSTSHQENQITINWEAVSGATAGYQVQHKTQTGNWSSSTDTTSTTQTISSLVSGTTYEIRVRAIRTNSPNNIESSWKTHTTTTKPQAPTSPTTSSHTTWRVALNWTPPTGNELKHQTHPTCLLYTSPSPRD